MSERYDHFSGLGDSDDDCPYEWIGEWLCEYVDGAMDPSMQAVFEEYLEANPELAAHVERLCHTRALLGACQCRGEGREEEAARRAKALLPRQQQEEERAQAAASRLEGERGTAEEGGSGAQAKQGLGEEREEEDDEPLAAPLSAGTVAAVASAMTLMVGVGMATGALLFTGDASRMQQQSLPAAPQEQADRAPDRQAVPPRASSSPARALGRRAAASSNASSSGMPNSNASNLSAWTAPPLPLKKMPAAHADDSLRAASSRVLIQRIGLGR